MLKIITTLEANINLDTVVLETVSDPVMNINEPVYNNSLYPNLDSLKVLSESFNKLGFNELGSIHSLPPPTYSDSESYYNDQKQSDSFKVIKPTAPSPPSKRNSRSVSFNLNQNQINELDSSFNQEFHQ
jgi:hypothetical protein